MSEQAAAQQVRQPAKPATPTRTRGVLQRACACGKHAGNGGECAECRKKRLGLQRRAVGNGPDVAPPIVHEVLRSPGRPLDDETRGFMESRFGHDFSGVRVHNDGRAAESARQVNAVAYAVGRDIAFDVGQYQPYTTQGRQLIAHELMHVIQQKTSSPFSISQVTVSNDTGSEAEASLAATSMNFAQRTSNPYVAPQRHLSKQLFRKRRQSRSGVVNIAVKVRWSDEDREFYHRLVDAVSRGTGIEREALFQPLLDQAQAFHTRYDMHSDIQANQLITVHFLAVHNPSERYSSVSQVHVLSDEELQVAGAKQRSEEERTRRVQVAVNSEPTAEDLERMLSQAGRKQANLDLTVTPDSVEFTAWANLGDEFSSHELQWRPSTRDAIEGYVTSLPAFRGEYPRLYRMNFAVEQNEWIMKKWELLAKVEPIPPAQPGAQVQAPNELDLIIQDVRANRQLVLTTAAMAIAEMDPTSIENLAMAVGPFAVTKISHVAKLRSLAKVKDLVRRVRIPNAVPLRRTGGTLDPELVRLARDVRVTQAGVTRQAFKQHNVATARVRVDGEIRYLDSGNQRGGAHSEEWLDVQITDLQRNHREVVLEQMYSERIPCAGTCGPLLERRYPNAEVFYTTRAESAAGRANELIEQYGLTGQLP